MGRPSMTRLRLLRVKRQNQRNTRAGTPAESVALREKAGGHERARTNLDRTKNAAVLMHV